MTEQIVSTVQCADPSRHPAVRVWLALDPSHLAPMRITSLKQRHKMSSKSSVYRLEGVSAQGRAVVTKRCRPSSGLLERRLYADILPSLGVRAPRYRGWVREPAGEYGWLIMDDVGDRWYSPLDERQRRILGRWLGKLHLRATGAKAIRSLPERGADHYLARFKRLEMGLADVQRRTDLTQFERAKLQNHILQCEVLSHHWHELEDICNILPKTLVHGDLVRKNLRIGTGGAEEEMIALDWENAGYGSPLADLAQCPDLESLPDFAASPDLGSYYLVVREQWKMLDFRNLVRIACAGTIFRCIDSLVWEVDRLEANGYAPRCIPRMAIFGTVLAGSMKAMGWRT
jgi:hypothetical protein